MRVLAHDGDAHLVLHVVHQVCQLLPLTTPRCPHLPLLHVALAVGELQDLQNALCALSVSEFTEETPDGQEEVSMTVHLDNAEFPTFTVTLYRYDGTNCIAVVDGTPVAFVSRSQTVNLIEAVNELTLGQ